MRFLPPPPLPYHRNLGRTIIVRLFQAFLANLAEHVRIKHYEPRPQRFFLETNARAIKQKFPEHVPCKRRIQTKKSLKRIRHLALRLNPQSWTFKARSGTTLHYKPKTFGEQEENYQTLLRHS